MRARRRDAGRVAAAEGVAAYLADEDAEVHNLTEAAVGEDALSAALHLTALAAQAVAELAAERGLRPEQVLRSLAEARSPDRQVVYPASMDEFDWAMTETKGWIEITVGGKPVTFYDPVRLAQEVRSGLDRSSYFAERAVVVVPVVTRQAIEAVIARMAQSGFAEIR